MIALVSAKGSPGVTTAGLAFTLTWGLRTVLAECDPAGGSLMAGYLQGELDNNRGMMPLAVAQLRSGTLAETFWSQLVDLDPSHRQRLLLPGLTDPAQAGSLNPLWPDFASFFAQLEFDQPGYDVIADCGRLAVANPPWPLLCAADTVLLAVRPTLASVSAAIPTAAAIRKELQERVASTSALGLLVIGEGPYGAGEVARHLQVPLVATLPDDDRSATVLSHGGEVRMTRPLMRAAAAAEPRIRSHVGAHRQQVPRRAILREATR